MKAKPWQIALIVIGLAVGIGSAAWTIFGGDRVELANVVLMVDVESGQIYEVNLNRTRITNPALHPTTGKLQLVRLDRSDDGTLFVNPRDMQLLQYLDKDVTNKAVDPKTGELLIAPGKPVRYPGNK